VICRFGVVLLAVYKRDKDEGSPRVILCPFGEEIEEGYEL